MTDLRKDADEIYQEFSDTVFNQFKKQRYGIGCTPDRNSSQAQNRKVLLDWQTGVYDEIFDRLSCRQPAALCDNTLLTARALYGWLPDPTILNTPPAIELAAQGQVFYPRGGSIPCDFTINLVPAFLWMAELVTEPVKTRYTVEYGMEGSIGNPDSDLFGTPLVIGPYRLYVTTYLTQANEAPIVFKVTP